MKLSTIIFLFFSIFSHFSYVFSHNIDYIRSIEQEALEQIRIAYNIERKAWDAFLGHVSTLRNEIKILLTQTNPDVQHDNNIPTEKLNIIYDIFKQQNINPQSIHIILDNEVEKSNTCASMHIRLFLQNAPEKYIIKDPLLKISPKILQDDCAKFTAVIYHELGHLFEVHTALEYLIKKLVESVSTKVSPDGSVEKENVKNNLNRIHEFIADQYFASQDKNISSILEKYLKPNTLCNYPPLSENWYPTIPERWSSFMVMKNKIYENSTDRQLL